MREIFGFAAGVTAAAMAAVFLRSEEGQKLLRRLQEQAEPELEAASKDWEPFLREAAKAVRLGADELSGAVDKLAAYLGTLADEASDSSDKALEPPALPATTDSSTPEG
jgi:ATP phosphoribosyltransferase regulatory subunit HisZ